MKSRQPLTQYYPSASTRHTKANVTPIISGSRTKEKTREFHCSSRSCTLPSVQEDAIVFQLGLGTRLSDHGIMVSSFCTRSIVAKISLSLSSSLSRHPVKLEAHSIAKVRDWWVGFQRDETQQLWIVDFKFHFETPDVDIEHTGSLLITIKDGESLIYSSNRSVTLTGDDKRESSVTIESFTIPFSKVSRRFSREEFE